MNEKRDCRTRIQKILSSMVISSKKQADHRISKTVIQLPEVIRSKTICCYESFGTEVDTKQLIKKLLALGKTIVTPENAGKISIDCYIVPGLAFDSRGHRLGRGGGFYDKLLSKITVPKIGLAYEVQVIAEVPITSYDISMTKVVTEKTIYENKTS